MVLPPGTILQRMYLKERLRRLHPGSFIEVGVGQGHLSAYLLALGWCGTGFELDPESAEATRQWNRVAIDEGRYSVVSGSWLEAKQLRRVDLVLSSMVLEHLNDADEIRYLQRCHECLASDGIGILFVPGSPCDWGIEDEIAGHYRRYTSTLLREKLAAAGWNVRHVVGLTFPMSNVLLPVSNFLVRRSEGQRRTLPMHVRTTSSGKRKVMGKTHFPSLAGLLLNEQVMYPFHVLQKWCARAERALVIYAEYTAARP